jgi:hypothetical protein
MMIRITSLALVLSVLVSVSSGEKYTYNFDNPANRYVENGAGDRFLQTGTSPCEVSGSRFICNIVTTVSASDGQASTINANLNCEFDSQIVADFRRAQGCQCSAQVVDANGGIKPCACTLCPSGYGNSPVSVDCDYDTREEEVDPYVVNTCTSFDCSSRCNGTCSFGCQEPVLPECFQLCGTPEPSGAPVGAPTTSGAMVPADIVMGVSVILAAVGTLLLA